MKGSLGRPRPAARGVGGVVGGVWLLFGVMTLQDRFAGPPAAPYTELKAQGASQNVEELLARGNTIQETLDEPAVYAAAGIAHARGGRGSRRARSRDGGVPLRSR